MSVMSLRATVVLCALCVGTASAADAPTLTDVQKLQIQNAVLRVQLAQSELERAKEQANALIHTLQKPGYTLDLDRLVYVPTTPKAEQK